jgi:hypothetical protein
MRSSRSALVAAALLGAIAMPGGVAFGSWGSRAYCQPGPGWTFAQVKRMAKKRRNVLRNRRAHRGGRK